MESQAAGTDGQTSQGELDSLLRDVEQNHLVALWNILESLVHDEPSPSCEPHLWRFADIKPLLLEAGRLVSSELAERRVLALDNPSLSGPGVTPTLFAGLQLLRSQEFQPPHRHTQAALRFVLEGSGAVTSVNDHCYDMEPGDLVLTPSWCWHAHEKKSEGSMIWLDGLDVPLVRFFNGSFAEHTEELGSMPHNGGALEQAQYGSGFAPPQRSVDSAHSPRMRYPYGPARAALTTLAQAGPSDPCHGVRRAYANPVTGGHVLPTIGAFLQLLPAGFDGVPARSTESTVYCVVEGAGTTRIGNQGDQDDRVLRWSRNDVFVVPNWTFASHRVEQEAVLFSFSDRPTLEHLGLLREERRPV